MSSSPKSRRAADDVRGYVTIHDRGGKTVRIRAQCVAITGTVREEENISEMGIF